MLRSLNRTLAVLVFMLLGVVITGLFATKRMAAAAMSRRFAQPAAVARLDTAVFAGGCFWGIQAVFQHVKGVKMATSGYAGGSVERPTYEQVSSGQSGHAESVRVIFDPAQVTYGRLMQVFFSVAHDPTQLDRQGPDVGPQYRSAIFYMNAAQRQAAESYIAQLDKSGFFKEPIVTKVSPLAAFYRAEEYHQNYAERHPNDLYILYNDAPKVDHLKRLFAAVYVEQLAGYEPVMH